MRAVALSAMFVVGGLMGLPASTAQVTADLEIGPLTGPDPFTVDGSDSLRLQIRNRGAAQVTGSVRFFYPDASAPGNEFHSIAWTRNAQEGRPVVFSWNGHMPPGAPNVLRGQHTVVARVALDAPFTTPADNERPFTAFFREFKPSLVAQPPSQANIDIGQSATQDFFVRNFGNAEDAVQLSITAQTPGWAFQLAPTNVVGIPAGGQQATRLTVSPPGDAGAGDAGSATIRGVSVNNPNAIATVASATFFAGGFSDFIFQVQPQEAVVDAGESWEAQVSAINRGNRPAVVELDATEITTFPPISFDSASLNVPRGETRSTMVRAETVSSTPAGTYPIQLSATDTETGATRTAVATVTVAQRYGVTMQWPSDDPATRTIVPGDEDSFAVLVTNTGNGVDRYEVAAAPLPAGWTSTPPSTAQEVGQGVQALYPVAIRVPNGTSPGLYDVTFNATSLGDPTRTAQIAAVVNVPSTPVPLLQSNVTRTPIEDGGSARVGVVLRNTGNAGGTFTLQDPVVEAASPESPAWTGRWEGGSVTFTIPPGGAVTRDLVMTAATGLTISSQATFLLEARSTNGRTSITRVDAQTAAADLAFRSLVVPSGPYLGQPQEIRVQVENVGTLEMRRATNVTLAVSKDGRTLTQVTQPLGALNWTDGANVDLVTFHWTPNQSGPHQLNFLIDPDDLIPEKAESNNEESASAQVRDLQLRLLPPADRQASPGQRVQLNGAVGFVVRNDGNADETVQLAANTTRNWTLSLGATSLTLRPLESRIAPLVIDVPAEPGVLEETVTLRVTPAFGNALTAQFVLNVRESNPPLIEWVNVQPQELSPGETVEISTRVSDQVGVHSVRAVLVSPGGIQQTVALQPRADRVWVGNHTASALGTYRASITALDLATPPNVASTQTEPKLFNVSVDAQPGLHFVRPAMEERVRGLGSAVATVNDVEGVRAVAATAYRVHRHELPADALMVLELRDVLGQAAQAPATLQGILDPDAPLIDQVELVQRDMAEALRGLARGEGWLLDMPEADGVAFYAVDEPVRTIPLPLGNPYSIGLAGLPEGPVALILEAENAFGVRNRTFIRFTVDNTPVRILDVQADGSQTSRTVVALVDGSPDLHEVTLDVTHHDGNHTTHVMEPTGAAGNYTATIDLSDAAEWRVTTKDAVGNVDFKVFSTTDAGKALALPRGQLPAPAAAWFVMVLVISLGALQRRPRP